MPRRNEPNVEIEHGFGTGLRTKLEGRRPEPTRQAAVPADEQAEAPAAVVAEEAPELTETEQLWAELEESLAREEALKQALHEQARAQEEQDRRLAERADALRAQEQKLEEQLRSLHEEAARLGASGPASQEEGAREHGRAYLRRRVEENGEPLWRVFQEALTATKTNGQPDFRTRLMAASTLLAEGYGDLAQMSPGEQVAAARDELAGKRARRAAKPK
jgi:chromosome segregation ATPase